MKWSTVYYKVYGQCPEWFYYLGDLRSPGEQHFTFWSQSINCSESLRKGFFLSSHEINKIYCMTHRMLREMSSFNFYVLILCYFCNRYTCIRITPSRSLWLCLDILIIFNKIGVIFYKFWGIHQLSYNYFSSISSSGLNIKAENIEIRVLETNLGFTIVDEMLAKHFSSYWKGWESYTQEGFWH